MDKIFVVEGKSDVNKIKSVIPHARVITTGGFSFGKALIDELYKLSLNNEIILFLDPDYAGESIRNIIAKKVKNVKHIYTRPELCQNGAKIGVEHLSTCELKKALEHIVTFSTKNNKLNITYYDLFVLGLTGGVDSKKMRNEICNKLQIRCRNANDFLTKINLLDFTLAKLKEMVKDVCS